MKRIITFSLILGIGSMLLTSCKKFDEGGAISKGDKRIVNTWTLNTYLRNSIDETSSLIISNFKEQYKDDGTLLRTYTDDKGDAQSQSGSYEFEDDEKTLKIDGVGSIEISSNTSTVSSSRFNIIKLTKSDFWYSFENGSDNHEFRFSS